MFMIKTTPLRLTKVFYISDEEHLYPTHMHSALRIKAVLFILKSIIANGW